ncbi:MAG TPA: YciI family protein [Chloroflexota bacterium]|nr:YciI family protein [Chloroflexota bacterium]
MKYVLLFGGTREAQQAWDTMPDDVRQQAYTRVEQWFRENGSKITGGYQLQSPGTATTVRLDGNGGSMVTDGPFIEGNEVIGGYAEIEVGDLDEALRMARTWPGGGIVEIRPVVAR